MRRILIGMEVTHSDTSMLSCRTQRMRIGRPYQVGSARARLILFSALALTLGPGTDRVQAQAGLEDVGFVLGDTTAPVKIIEFGDFACTTCTDFFRDSWPRVQGELIETGRVVWWHVPVTLGYRGGKEAANAAQCAAEQDGYWRMHDLLLGTQEEWLSTRQPTILFARMASEARLNIVAFSACYEENRWEERTKAATRIARRGIRGLPTFFVNGRPLVGAVPYGTLLQLVVEAERTGPGSGHDD